MIKLIIVDVDDESVLQIDEDSIILEMDDDGSRGTTESFDKYKVDIENMIERLCRMYGLPARYVKDKPNTLTSLGITVG